MSRQFAAFNALKRNTDEKYASARILIHTNNSAEQKTLFNT